MTITIITKTIIRPRLPGAGVAAPVDVGGVRGVHDPLRQPVRVRRVPAVGRHINDDFCAEK